MSDKKKPVGMAFDISTGKSYKVYKPEPETITLTLTREQAEFAKSTMEAHFDKYGWYKPNERKLFEDIKKQIEEKLSK